MSINLIRRQYSGTPQHPSLFGVEFGNDKNAIFWLSSTTFPGRDLKWHSLDWMNGVYHFIGRTTPNGTWNCGFYLFEDMAPMKYLHAWHDRTFNPYTGQYGTHGDYTIPQATVFMLDSTGTRRTIQWVMKVVSLVSIGGLGTLSFASDEIKTVEASFQYEHYELLFGGEGLAAS